MVESIGKMTAETYISASSLAGKADPEGDKLLSRAKKSKKQHLGRGINFPTSRGKTLSQVEVEFI